MRKRGAQAYGIEIDGRFIECGKVLEALHQDEFPILSTVDATGKSIFPDRYFDIVLSDQVLEHVADLSSVTREIARVLRPNGITCHQFPAKFRITEPHYKLPFARWIPKGPVRRSVIELMLKSGLSEQFFPDPYGMAVGTTSTGICWSPMV